MAIVPSFRAIIFTFVTLTSLVVLGICAHLEYLVAGFTDVFTSFIPFGIGIASLTILSLPLFLILGNLRTRVFTSSILFEIIWFFILWILWVGDAADTVIGRINTFPDGCVFDFDPLVNQVCYEITVVEALAFVNFLCAFIYYGVILLYAIINAIRGRGVWTSSVKQAATGAPTVNPEVPIVQSEWNAAPGAQYQPYGAYPANAPPAQHGPYGAYPQQVVPQFAPGQPYPQQVLPQGLPPQPYPQQVLPQGVPPQQYYGVYPQQALPGQNQPYNYAPSGSPQQQVNYAGYSPTQPPSGAALPPQPNYTSHPARDPQAPVPLPGEYRGLPAPEQQLPSPYEP